MSLASRTWVCLALALALAPAACREAARDDRVIVALAGARFELELAADVATQHRGLGKRDRIEADGGMLFAYPEPRPLTFVMRDCLVPIDLAFLDREGRVLELHWMRPEAPRRAGETARRYELRLRRYSSRTPAQFAIETAGGRLRELGVRPGAQAVFDRDAVLEVFN